MVLHMARGGLMVADAHSTLQEQRGENGSSLHSENSCLDVLDALELDPFLSLLDIRYRDAAGLFVETC